MVEGKGHEDVQLEGWLDIMGQDNPLRYLRWLAGGARENESMVVHHMRLLEADLLKSFPKIDSRLYTNCLDVEGWNDSYIVPHETAVTKLDHIFQIQVHIVSAMYQEEGMTADCYVTNGLASAWALYGHGLSMWNRPLPPVIAVMAKSPEELWDYVTPEAAVFMLRSLARCDTFWIFSLDNANEVRLMEDLLVDAGAPLFPRIRRVKTYSWSDRSAWRGKEDVVVWSGRMSKMKNPRLAADVYSLIPEVEKEVFFSREAGQMGADHRAFLHIKNTSVHTGEPPEIYRRLTKRAKVLLLTSFAEGLPAGFIELMGQGSVPVVWKRGWKGDIFPDSWPLFYETPGEGAEMVKIAMENYPALSRKLRVWMSKRFGEPVNFSELLSEVWKEYTVRLGDRMRLVAERGTRRAL